MKRLTLIRRYCVILCVFLVFIVHVRCMNMWTSYEGKQTGDGVDKKKSCVSPCRVFHSLCKNDGKCREKTKDCTWYCECPENCEGFFCERIIKETNKDGNIDMTIMVEKTKKKPISAFDKSKLTKALANIYTNRLKTSEDKVEKGPASIERVDTSNTIDVKENVTTKISVYCPPETALGGAMLKNVTTTSSVPEQKESTETPAAVNESYITQTSKTSSGVKTNEDVDISTNNTNAVNSTEGDKDNNVNKTEETVSTSPPPSSASTTTNKGTGKTVSTSPPPPSASITPHKGTGKIVSTTPSPSASTTTKKATGKIVSTSPSPSASTTTKKTTGKIVSTSPSPSASTTTKKATGKIVSTSPSPTASTTTKKATSKIVSTSPSPTASTTTKKATGKIVSTSPSPTTSTTTKKATGKIVSTSPSPTATTTTKKATGKIVSTSPSPSAPTTIKKATDKIVSTLPSQSASTSTKKATGKIVSTSPSPSASTSTKKASVSILPSPSVFITTQKATSGVVSTSPSTPASKATRKTITEPSSPLKRSGNNNSGSNVSNSYSKNYSRELSTSNDSTSVSNEPKENRSLLSETLDPKVDITKLKNVIETNVINSGQIDKPTDESTTTQQAKHTVDNETLESSSRNKFADTLTVSNNSSVLSNEHSTVTPNVSLARLQNESKSTQSDVTPITTTIKTVSSTSETYQTKSISSATRIPSTSTSSTTMKKNSYKPNDRKATTTPKSKIVTTENTSIISKTTDKQPIVLSNASNTVLSTSHYPQKTTPSAPGSFISEGRLEMNTTIDGNSLDGTEIQTKEPLATNDTTLFPSTRKRKQKTIVSTVAPQKLESKIPTPISTTSIPTTPFTSTTSKYKEADPSQNITPNLASETPTLNAVLPANESMVQESRKSNTDEAENATEFQRAFHNNQAESMNETQTSQEYPVDGNSSKVSEINTQSSTTKIIKTDTTTVDTTEKTVTVSTTLQTIMKNGNTDRVSSTVHLTRSKEEDDDRTIGSFQQPSSVAKTGQRSIKPLVLEPDLASNKLTDKIHKLKDAELDTLKNGLHDIVLKSKNAYDIFSSNKLQPNDREDKLLVGSVMSTTASSV